MPELHIFILLIQEILGKDQYQIGFEYFGNDLISEIH